MISFILTIIFVVYSTVMTGFGYKLAKASNSAINEDYFECKNKITIA